ncbi:MAG TPA: ATP-binding protein, partial [Bryobacteraceae bacterium]|nr:ATP-binding protein [Bryobacteraceae bacterium]
MTAAILSSDVRYEQDVVHARQLARQLARLLGLDQQDQARISTAVSEIARNAFYYANGGRIVFLVEGRTQPQRFVIRVIDHGPGIDDLSSVLEGRYQSPTGMGLGIVGARRLMDHFEIRSAPGVGTEVVLSKLIPKHRALITEADVSRIAAALGRERPADPFQELRHQNQELMRALDGIRARQQELTRLNRELEDTNRGVVALYAELDDRADHLRRADELKSKFLSNMSHEFRSPLNSILALTGLLRDCADGPLTGEQEQQVNFIRRAAQDLLDLVNDLLDLAKVEAGKLEARPVEFAVADLFAALRGMLRPLSLNPSVDLVFEDASHIPPLFTDEGKLSQILRNFISNALKFTERGEVRVSAALAGDEGIELSVSDTGIGIAPEHQEVIFEDFFQLDHPIQHGVKGTGLGLPLSRRLATFLGGSVELRSARGAGSTFTVRVPRNYSVTPAKSAVETHAPAHHSADLPVLFIGDPEDILEYQNSLRASGFRLIIASTVRDAESALERLKPCAIVLDMIVHAESAWPLLAELRQASRTKGIPVIVAGTPKDRAKSFYPGADAWLM